MIIKTFKESLNVLLIILNNGFKNMTLFSIFDIYNTLAFIGIKRKKTRFFYFIFKFTSTFTTSLWHDDFNKEMKLCLKSN